MNRFTDALHNAAVAHGCAFSTETLPGNGGEGEKTVTKYSLRELTVTAEGGAATASIKTPFIGLKRLFDTTGDPAVRELLFNSARPCTHCISDKCTTLLMAPMRTLTLNGQSKKVCSMWGQLITLPLNDDNFAPCVKIVGYYLAEAEAAQEAHADIRRNDVTYTMIQTDEFFIAGYRHQHTSIGASDEDAVKALLARMPTLCRALGVPDPERYIGATADFVNGSQYHFIFGVMLGGRPDAGLLPEGAVVRRIRSGEWAVYNSTLADYKSIWRHYTDSFYALERRGWDASRIPFEIYDRDGNWRDVHIPVDAAAPSDAGRLALWEYRPDFVTAGFDYVGEEDHPDRTDMRAVEKRYRELVKTPGVSSFGYSLHQYYGKPMRFSGGIVADGAVEIPEDFKRITIKGGLWRINATRHFNGGAEMWDMDEPYRLPFEKQRLGLDHPRVFGTYAYDARGGYDETWIPCRQNGRYVFEIVELPPLKMFARLEDPLNGKTVPDEELRSFYGLPGNKCPGTLIVGYKPALFGDVMLYAEPLIKGVAAADGAAPPDGFAAYTLDGGRFVRLTEVNPDGSLYPRGEPGWEVEFIRFPNPEIKESTDFTRYCRMLQTGGGRYYELYVPVG